LGKGVASGPEGGELNPAEGVRKRCNNVSPPQRDGAVSSPLTSGEANSPEGPTIRLLQSSSTKSRW